MDKLVFSQVPSVTLATNQFVQVPVILQYDDTPLIEVVRVANVGFTTSVPIYHPDGTYLAKAVGSRLFATEDGKKAGVTLEHPDKMTICKLNGKTVFEMHRDEAAALHTRAELYTPTGYFVKIIDDPKIGLFDRSGSAIKIGGMVMSHNIFVRCRIGVWIQSNGSIALGVA